MAKAKKEVRVKKEPKAILYLHVKSQNKKWFNQVAANYAAKSDGKVTVSMVADKLLERLKGDSRALKQLLEST